MLVKGAIAVKLDGCESHRLGVWAKKVLKKYFEKVLIVRGCNSTGGVLRQPTNPCKGGG